MSKIVTILSINSSKLINTVFAYLMEMFLQLINAIGFVNIGLSEIDYNRFAKSVNNLMSLVKSTHASSITKLLKDLDTQRDDAFKCLLGVINSYCSHPVPAKNAAANYLCLIIKPYIGTQRLANNEESQSIFSLNEQFKEPKSAHYIKLLGLEDVLAGLLKANSLYIENHNKRLEEDESTACATSRLECTEQFENICIVAQSNIIANPTPEGLHFIEQVNKLIKDINTSYKQKKSHSHHKDEPVLEEGDVSGDIE